MNWACVVCGRGFVHARFLADHLLRFHPEVTPCGP